MPCDTIQLNRVDLDATKMVPHLMEAALKAMGATQVRNRSFLYQGNWYQLEGSQLVSQAGNVGEVADLARRHYSAQVVRYSALKSGFQVKQTGAFSYQVIRG